MQQTRKMVRIHIVVFIISFFKNKKNLLIIIIIIFFFFKLLPFLIEILNYNVFRY